MKLSIEFFVVCLVAFAKYVYCQDKCNAAIDLTLIIDSSASISPDNFQKSKEALVDIVSRLNVGTKKAGVALINYASNVTLDAQNSVFEFEKGVVIDRISKLPHIRTRTATGDALVLARRYCEARCRSLKEGVPRVFAIFTDGHSNEGQPVIPAAEALRNAPIEGTVFAIGIGNIGAKGEKELVSIAGDKANVLKIDSYLDLIRAANTIAIQMCDFPAFVEPEVDTSVQIEGATTRYFKMHTLNRAAKNAFFEIEVHDKQGQSVVYTSTTDRKPTALTSKSIMRRNLDGNIYTTYVPANAKNFYFCVKGVKSTMNKSNFIVRVHPVDF